MTVLVLIFVLAGSIAVAAKLLAGKGLFGLAGVTVVLPVNTVLGWWIVAAYGNDKGLKVAVAGSFLGIITLAILALATWASVWAGISPRLSIAIGLCVWGLANSLVWFSCR